MAVHRVTLANQGWLLMKTVLRINRMPSPFKAIQNIQLSGQKNRSSRFLSIQSSEEPFFAS
jgi:hypothetical protein